MSKKRAWFVKKFLALFLILPLLLVGCGKTEEKDEIVSLKVDQNFLSQDFYVGDQVDLSSYSLTLVYSSGKEESVPLSIATIQNFSTAVAGEIDVVITYAGLSVTVHLLISNPAPVNMRYAGEGIVFYYGEGFDLENQYVFVLYDSGDEVKIPLADLELEDLGGGVLRAKFFDLHVDIEYVSLYHEIELLQEYEVNNPFMGGEFVGQILQSNNELVLLVRYAQSGRDYNVFGLTDMGDGHYETQFLFDGDLRTYEIYLANGKIQIVEKA